MFENEKKNQHYVAQVEQRLNAINSSVSKKNQRIYKFILNDRDSLSFSLFDEKGVKIENNLSWNNLYTYEFTQKGLQKNFENYFNNFECKIDKLTEEILSNHQITKENFFNLLEAKYLNIFRNPYNIKWVLERLNQLIIDNIRPANPDLNKEFEKINFINVNQKVLDEFQVTLQEYKNWLKIIFLLVVDFEIINSSTQENFNLLKLLIDGFFDISNNYVMINLFVYTGNCCVLPDKGYINFDGVFGVNSMGVGFNLNKNSFIICTIFGNNLDEILLHVDPKYKLAIEGLKRTGRTKLQQYSLPIKKNINDLSLLKVFNRNAIQQCHKAFFSANKDFQL